MRRTACALFLLMMVSPAGAQSAKKSRTDLIVLNFSVSQEMTGEVLRSLARQTHTVIGVSGELIGPDAKLISISADQTPLKAVLDDICSKDPRYRWHETADGNVSVSVGKKRLELLDVVIGNMKIGSIDSPDLMMLISKQSEVRNWATDTGCHIIQVFAFIGPAGSSADKTWNLDINVKSEPLWKVLNDVSLQNETYFWSAIEFSTNPCTIDLIP